MPARLGDLGRGRLRGRDDHELRVGEQLGDGDGDVARAGRQVQEQHVEVAPPDVGEELLQRAVQHRPAERDRLETPPGLNGSIEMTRTP